MNRTIPCALALTMLATLALGARATALLDGVETALTDAIAALAGDETKAGKKRVKTATQSLKKIAKDTTSELGDVKLLKKIAGGTLKRFADDAVVTQAFVDAADAIDASIEGDIESIRGRIPAGKKVTAAKVTKAVDKAQALLGKSRIKPTTKARIAALFKARKGADKAAGLADKLAGQGGGDLELEVTNLVVDTDGNGAFRLFEIDMATGARTQADTGADAVSVDSPIPLPSPDGSVLALGQGMNIVLVDISGTPAVTHTTPTANWGSSDWSPDGTHLAASGVDPDTLAVFDLLGSTVRSVAHEVKRGFPKTETLMWSRDGDFLAYRTDLDTNGVKELRVLEMATGDVTEVSGAGLGTDQIRYVEWSRVSDKLVYPANEDDQTNDVELNVVNADGTGALVLSQAGEDVLDASADESLAMNPVADAVAYEFRSGGMAKLATVNLDGSEHHVIATGSANFFGAYAWAPDGSRVVYLDSGALHSVNPDGTDDVMITASCPDFRFTADGKGILYRDGNGGSVGNEIFICNLDGSDPVNLSPDPSTFSNVLERYTSSVVGDAVIVTYMVKEAGDHALRAVLVQAGDPAKFLFSAEEVYRSSLGILAGLWELEFLEATSWSFEGVRTDFVTVLVYDSSSGSLLLCTYVIVMKLKPDGLPDLSTRRQTGSCREVMSDEALYQTTVEKLGPPK